MQRDLLSKGPRNRPGRAGLGLIAAAALLTSGGASQKQADSPYNFREHFVAPLPGGYQCSVADVNGDGRPDIIALSGSRSEIAWYENPGWQKHLITTATHGNIDIAAFDLDGDGKMEIAVASDFNLGNSREGGRLQWFKPAPSAASEWVGHDIAAIPTIHRIRWADWDGNGKKELVVAPILGPGATAPNYSSPLSLLSYRFETRDGTVVSTPHIIDRSLTVAHGVRVLDWDGNGRDCLLTASFEGITLFKPVGTGDARTWRRQSLAAGEQSEPAPRRGTSEVDRGWLKHGHPFLAAIEPWHGNKVVVYTPPANGNGLWNRRVIDDLLQDGHALVCMDLDGDGRSEIVAGYRGGEHNLYGYRCVDPDGAKWERFTIDKGNMAAACVAAADLNGDGHPDLIACGSATANVKWYENLVRRNDAFNR